jgi:hypothetical protein
MFINDKFAANVRFLTSSNKEDVKVNKKTTKLVVDRTSYGLGMSFYPMGVNNKFNIVINPDLAFGIKKDIDKVETQNGLMVKVSGLIRVQNNLGIEVGISGDNLENADFKGDLYAGVGYLF